MLMAPSGGAKAIMEVKAGGKACRLAPLSVNGSCWADVSKSLDP